MSSGTTPTSVPTTPTPRPSAADEGTLAPAYRLITVSLLAVVTIIAFESMAISTAMPAIADALDSVTSYGLAFSVFLTSQLLGIVVSGVWSDRSGPLPGMLAGQLLIGAGSALCALAGTESAFLAGRGVAGFGAGVLVVTLYVIVGRAYPARLRPKVFSLVSSAWVLPSLVGAPIAGALTSWISWRAVFWVVVAPILLTFAAIWTRRAQLSAHDEGIEVGGDARTHRRSAWAGALVALAAGVLQFGTHDLVLAWSGRTVLAVVGVVGVVLATPLLVPRGTWRMGRGLPSVILSRGLMSAAFFGSLTYVPLMLVRERGLSIGAAGLVIAVGSLGWSAGSWIQGRDAFDGRRSHLITAGGAALACGLTVLAAVAWFGWHPMVSGAALVLGGVGMGLANSSTSVLSMSLSPVERHSSTSASLQVSDVLGSVLGIAAAGAAFAALTRGPGQDAAVYALIWGTLAVVALVVVAAGRRIRT